MIPGSFEYHRPKSVGEAVSLLSAHGDESRVIAGGHSLIPLMKMRLATPAHLIDLHGIAEIKGISESDGVIRIGAMTTQQEIIASELLAEICPILPETARLIADPQVRAWGTIGGNVANGDPGNDMPGLMLCLDASYQAKGPGGARSLSARSYYEAAFFTALAEDEVLTEIRIPVPAAGHGHAYEKMKRKVGDYATAAAAVILQMEGETCRQASIALTNVGQTPLYAEAAAEALAGRRIDDAAITEAASRAAAVAEPVSDLRGPADFRSHVAGVMTRRAIAKALERAQGR